MNFTAPLLLCLTLCLPGFGAPPQNELQRANANGRRVLSNGVVDISPLIQWRTSKRGPRPLPAWHFMTGRILAVKQGQWLMEVQIEGEAGRRKILLQHPPESARAEFSRLKQEHDATQANLKESTDALSASKQNLEDARQNAQAQTPLRRRQANTRDEQNANPDAWQARDDFRASKAEARAARQDAAEAKQQARQFDSKGYNLQSEFQFMGYALKLREGAPPENLPIYDHGTLVYR